MTTDQDAVISPPRTTLSGVGATLKAARQAMGKELPEVAAQLRIRQPFLAALEDGRHKDLPGGTYAIGFLRTYADFLALDAEELVRRFKMEAAGDLDARAELVFPSPVSEGRVPGGAVIFLGLLLAGIGYGGWYWLSSNSATVAEAVPPVPERLAAVQDKPAEPKPEDAKPAEPAAAEPGKPANDVVVPPAEAEDDKAPAPGAATPAAAPTPTETAKPAPVAEAPKPAEPAAAPASAAADPSGARILLKASTADCWIQVREMDGQLLLSRLLRKGDAYPVPNRPGLMLMVGNAGALEITVDGKAIPALGAPGQVRRDIKLEPEKLLPAG